MKAKALFILLAVLIFSSISYSQNLKADAPKNQPKTPEELLKLAEENRNTEYDAWMSKWKDKPLPAFSLKDLNGNTVTNESIKGKVAVINFWFINCKGCVAEFPELNHLKSQFKNEDVVFLGMALDHADSLKSFLTRKTFDFNVLARSAKFADQLSVDAYPTSIVIDGNGVIKEIFVGGIKNVDEKIAAAINRVRKK